MRAHAKTVGDGFEVFSLLVNAVATAPPPGLVDEGSVGGIHQADDSVVYAYGHFSSEIGELIFVAELFDLGRGLGSFGWFGGSRALRARVGDVGPDEFVLLFAGIAAGVDAVHSHRLIRGKRGDELALSVMHVELPAVIRALEIFAVELSGIQGHAAVRAAVA